MIIELFGLASTGKSFLKSKIRESDVFDIATVSTKEKLLNFSQYLLVHPLKTLQLFLILNTNHLSGVSLSEKLKALRMRNSYLAFVLAKSRIAKKHKKPVVIDEFSLQALFMIMQKKAGKKTLQNIMNLLPKADEIITFSKQKALRDKTYAKEHAARKGRLLMPASFISNQYAKQFMNVMEHNFEIIVQVLKESKKQAKSSLQSTLNSMPKTYKEQIKVAAYKSL